MMTPYEHFINTNTNSIIILLFLLLIIKHTNCSDIMIILLYYIKNPEIEAKTGNFSTPAYGSSSGSSIHSTASRRTRQRPLILAQVIPSSHRSLEGGRSVCTQHKILGSLRSPRLAPRVCTARVPSSNQSAVLSQCTIAAHAADAPRPISTGKLLHLQETAVTKPHRIKNCDKKAETQKNVHTMQ
jgi:hypothetical protein